MDLLYFSPNPWLEEYVRCAGQWDTGTSNSWQSRLLGVVRRESSTRGKVDGSIGRDVLPAPAY